MLIDHVSQVAYLVNAHDIDLTIDVDDPILVSTN